KEPRGIGSEALYYVVWRDHISLALRHGRTHVRDHSLRKQPLDRLIVLDETHVAHHLGPEARINKVQDGVRDSADVLVDLEPIRDFLAVERGIGILRVAVAIEIPGGIDEGVHGVGLSARRFSALRALYIHEFRHARQWRLPLQADVNVVRQEYRQIVFRHRHHATLWAVDHGNGGSPIALARYAPILQAIGDGSPAEPFLFRYDRHLLHSFATA